jgi:hypothetical protein
MRIREAQNIWIVWIRIRNTGFQFMTLLLRDFFGGEFPVEHEVVIISWDDMEKI